MKSITSADNAHFKQWRRIAESPRDVRRVGRTLAEGTHLAQAIFAAGHPVEAVLVRRTGTTREAISWAERFATRGAASFELAATLFDRVAPVERGSGLVLVIGVPAAGALDPGDALYLDGVQDPGNAGALLRVAAAAGVRNVLTAPGSVALWSPKVLRGGQGAHFALTLHEAVEPARVLEVVPAAWIATDAHGGEPLWTADLDDARVGWVIGSEGAGISPAAATVCGRRVTIPIAGAAESLNVAAAAAICLFERQRRRFVSQAGMSAPR